MPEPLEAARRFVVPVPPERLAEAIEEQIGRLTKSVRLPGFRPGKVPAAVIRQRYGDRARADAVRALSEEAAASVTPRGAILGSVEMAESAEGLTFTVESTWLGDLPEPDWAAASFERLKAASADLEELGLDADELEDHLREQVFDWLDETYRFPVFNGLVEREFAKIWQEAAAHGATEADGPAFHDIAERRLRVGAVVTELARRFGIAGGDVENAVLAKILAKVQVRSRPVNLDELRERFG